MKSKLEFNRNFAENSDVVEGGDDIEKVEDIENSKKDEEEISLKKKRR